MDTLDVLGYFKKITKCTPNAQYNVVPSDKLSEIEIKSFPFLLCVNVDESNKPGTHWVAFFIARVGSELEFFDSFGKSISEYPAHFINFARKNSLRILESNIMLQSPLSNVCGHYVIAYVCKRLQGCSRRAFYSQFTNNLDQNDKIVHNFSRKIFIQKFKSCKYFQICRINSSF